MVMRDTMNFKTQHFKLVDFLTKGHERTLRAKKNISVMFLLKGLNIIVVLALVPLTINYLDPTRYGIWITLSSIVGWFGIFDIGLGHGLRNKFAEALASGDRRVARVYVSTTYAIISIITASALLLFYSISPFLNWAVILNVKSDIALDAELSILALIVFTFFCLRFVLKLIITILNADQRPALASTFDLFGNIIAFCVIYILTITTDGSLQYVGFVYSSAPVLVLIVSSIWFYKGKYSAYKPSIEHIDFSKASLLLNLGVKFFIIQIVGIVLYQTNNIIISHLYGPEQVTPYSIAYKYFSVLMIGFGIIITPFWSAFTEAWVKKDLGWIKTTMHQLFRLWGLLVIAAIVMFIISNWVFRVWVGDLVFVPNNIKALIVIWVLLNAWNGIFSHFLNGLSKIKIQLYLGVIAALLNIPLAIYLGIRIGIEGVLIANIIVTIFGVLAYPVQYHKLINNKAEGIWNN